MSQEIFDFPIHFGGGELITLKPGRMFSMIESLRLMTDVLLSHKMTSDRGFFEVWKC